MQLILLKVQNVTTQVKTLILLSRSVRRHYKTLDLSPSKGHNNNYHHFSPMHQKSFL